MQRCDICGGLIWGRPHRLLIGFAPATAGQCLEVCAKCNDDMLAVQHMLQERRTVMEDAGAAAVHREID